MSGNDLRAREQQTKVHTRALQTELALQDQDFITPGKDSPSVPTGNTKTVALALEAHD